MTLSLFAKFLSLLGYPQRFVSPFSPSSSVVPFTLSGTTAETTAYSAVIPAGTWKPGGRVRIFTMASSNAGRAGFWQYKTYVNNVLVGSQNNSTTLGAGSTVFSVIATSSTSATATGAIEGFTSASVPVGVPVNLAIDTPFKITMTNASAADTTQVICYYLEIINP